MCDESDATSCSFLNWLRYENIQHTNTVKAIDMTPVVGVNDAKTNTTCVLTAEAIERGGSEAKAVSFDVPQSGSESEDSAKMDALRWRLSPTGSMDDVYLRELMGAGAEGSPAVRSFVRRSKSCGMDSSPREDGKGAYRLNISYRDEGLRERCERNTQQLLQTALDEASANSTSAILARKALRYRKILQRMEDENVDVSDPSFDVSACLGVRWRRVAND